VSRLIISLPPTRFVGLVLIAPLAFTLSSPFMLVSCTQPAPLVAYQSPTSCSLLFSRTMVSADPSINFFRNRTYIETSADVKIPCLDLSILSPILSTSLSLPPSLPPSLLSFAQLPILSSTYSY